MVNERVVMFNENELQKVDIAVQVIYKRNCSGCGEEITYSTKCAKVRAEKRNTNCKSCAKKNKNNPMYGKSVYDMWVEKCGKKEADKRQKERNKKLSESKLGDKNPAKRPEVRKKISKTLTGTKPSNDARKNMRISRLKNIEKNKGQIMPNSNPEATRIIRAKAKELGITDLQDAETPGGEFQVCGYFVDGRSKGKNIVFEYYEPFHRNQVERDDRRKREIIKELGCKFIEIWYDGKIKE
jgi:hypothetical protein